MAARSSNRIALVHYWCLCAFIGSAIGQGLTIKNERHQQLRVKPQPSALGSGLPVPDLLESPDAKYDPKPKDIDVAALRLRLKGNFSFFKMLLKLKWPTFQLHNFCLTMMRGSSETSFQRRVPWLLT